MPTLLHLADERDARKIEKGGIKVGRGRAGVFFMPVTPEFYASHQWLRELKRQGAKTMVGVYFKLAASEKVWFGKYHDQHLLLPLGKAIGEFMAAADKLGYEFLIERKIGPDEITGVRRLPQKIGWRYSPDSHEKGLGCGCPICIRRGSVRSRHKRAKFIEEEQVPPVATLLERIRSESNPRNLEDHLNQLLTRKRTFDPTQLRFLLDERPISIGYTLAPKLQYFKHAEAWTMLIELLSRDDVDYAYYAAQGLIKLDGNRAMKVLEPYRNNREIDKMVREFMKYREDDDGKAHTVQ